MTGVNNGAGSSGAPARIPVYCGVKFWFFYVVFCRPMFDLVLLAIVLSVLWTMLLIVPLESSNSLCKL